MNVYFNNGFLENQIQYTALQGHNFQSMELLELYKKRQNNISMFNFSADWHDWGRFYNEQRTNDNSCNN